MIYLASPYSHPHTSIRQIRFQEACEQAASMMKHGHLVFSPIAHSHSIAVYGDIPVGWEYWEKFDLEMLQACDSLLVLKLSGWQESIGVKREIEIMQELKRPIQGCYLYEAQQQWKPLTEIK